MAKKVFQPLKRLPIGAIKPEGWLLNQLILLNDLQKKLGNLQGLIKNGRWTGDEALPRYARGLVLLSGTLEKDKQLREKARYHMEITTMPEAIEVFSYTQKNYPELFKLFYEASGAEYKGGELQLVR